MADLASYTRVFRAELNGVDSTKVSKRNRHPISCTACRLKKLRCDRQRPCGACVKRDEAGQCEFVSASSSELTKSQDKSRVQAQVRLKRLEELVNGLIQSGGAGGAPTNGHSGTPAENTVPNEETQGSMVPESSPHSTSSRSDAAIGCMTTQGVDSNYVGATHWAAILEGINEINGYLQDDGVPPISHLSSPIAPGIGIDMFVGGPQEPVTLEDVLGRIPPRSSTDKLLTVYFASEMLMVPFIHSKKFQREYEAFWENPASASWLWLSILFSLLCLAQTILDSNPRLAFPAGVLVTFKADEYMGMSGQCLMRGQYFKAQPYAVESLLLYCRIKYTRSTDSDPIIWSLFGHLTRLAQRMGFHRDSKYLSSKKTPFEGEMRRRVWLFVETFDLLFSFQLGLPAIIHEDQVDTAPPSHLLDEDFDEDCEELPPARPLADPTSMVYYVWKSEVIRMFRRIVGHVLSTRKPSYEQTMNLDLDLRAFHFRVPPVLKMKRISLSFADPVARILQRVMTELRYQSGLCVLHRVYLALSKENPTFAYSRATCVSAALTILDLQNEYHLETKQGGRLENDTWLMSSLTMHDFLLGATIVCLDLSVFPNGQDRIKKIQCLTTSYKIWTERKHTSVDAAHGSRILGLMLSKLAARDSNLSFPTMAPSNDIMTSTTRSSTASTLGESVYSQPDAPSRPTTNGSSFSIPMHLQAPMPPPQTAFTLPEMPESMGNLDDGALQHLNDPGFLLQNTTVDPLATVFDASDSIDWLTIDQYLLDRTSLEIFGASTPHY